MSNNDSYSGQAKLVLNLLRQKPRTTLDLRAEGILHPAGRIMELRNQGHRIDTVKVRVKSGIYAHNGVAIYVLQKERRA